MTLPFNPSYGSGQSQSATGTSAQYTIRTCTRSICVTNTGSTNPVFVRIGQGTVTATTADYIVMPNSQVSLGKFQDDDNIALISPSGTTVNFICGAGL